MMRGLSGALTGCDARARNENRKKNNLRLHCQGVSVEEGGGFCEREKGFYIGIKGIIWFLLLF